MNSSSISGPLMCWDFFMQGHYNRMQEAESFSKLKLMAKTFDWRLDWDLKKLVWQEKRVVLVTDTEQVIQFASANMRAMNGFSAEEVLGKKPKIFQGQNTQPETRSLIREAIIRRIPFKGEIINYRKNGTPYNCLVEEYPVWNKGGDLVHFIAFEKIA